MSKASDQIAAVKAQVAAEQKTIREARIKALKAKRIGERSSRNKDRATSRTADTRKATVERGKRTRTSDRIRTEFKGDETRAMNTRREKATQMNDLPKGSGLLSSKAMDESIEKIANQHGKREGSKFIKRVKRGR